MRSIARFATAAIALAVISSAVEAQTQTVTFSVSAISTLSFGANPAALNVTAAAAGQPPNAVSTTSTYSITTNEANRKITAAINTPMPTGVTLSTNLAAPSTGTSAGTTSLGVAPVDVVTSIAPVSQAGLGITYTLSAAATAGPVSSSTRVVTYTIVAGT
jgi:hypothetical protein